MDLEDKLKQVKEEITSNGVNLENAKTRISELKKKAREYQKLIDKAKDLEK